MLQTPAPSPYDLGFRLLGVDVRISFTFWIAAILFGFGLVASLNRGLGPDSPGVGILLVLWMLLMALSILIHEFGHAVAFRAFGIHSHIVLYHFGGLAIPTSGRSATRVGIDLKPWQDFVVAIAGPAAQLLSALFLAAILVLSGHVADGLAMVHPTLGELFNQGELDPLPNPTLRAAVVLYMLPSIYWAILNCVPTFPLDGGRMCRAIVEGVGGAATIWIWIGIVSSAAMAMYAFQGGQSYMAIFFALMAVSNYQMLPRFS